MQWEERNTKISFFPILLPATKSQTLQKGLISIRYKHNSSQMTYLTPALAFG